MEIKFIRKIDELGRIVIPKDVRNLVELAAQDYVELSLNNEFIMIRKAEKQKNEKH